MKQYITASIICCLTVFIVVGQTKKNKEQLSKKESSKQVKTKKLKIERQFNVKPEKVFGAFTNPDEMRVWWTEDTEFDIDLQVGGHYTIIRKEGDATHRMTGKYLEVEKPIKLKYTCSMPDFSPITDTITIEIQATEKGGSKMIFIQEGEGIDGELSKLPTGIISESEKGWQLGFDLMEQAWKKSETK